ncbi:NAD(P)-dependent dehydrogenase (short-subunit alcohol dehydrogenase family) [Saccharothrix ecbatanensis]|uniref:NAD(P)-dependent dehydrogenase (Short-subunit alcohol dehydrogenase family) n=1 Tax=Saccharothrix ecbatanensis TaxID=1105145 RepID=A0A7W9HJP4_9PSEU|nr:glucose 1-dehydrogenase [Saccharothrix ecbatanensis]MBB5803375.1 NAD(P)-dependent dehydrogenase (short-subunit alcohol dehydrogenase family) [Saccharothrix ecbatanensis]
MINRFEGRTVVVTGAGSGIGYEMARQFHAEGAIVFAADLDPDTAPEGTIGLRVDVTDPGSVESGLARAVEETGKLDVLCNNAGFSSTTDVVSCGVDEWDKVFAVNTRGVFLGIKYAVPTMLEQGGGAIINTASVAGMVGLKDRAAYCASKGAVVALTRQVAVQYAGTGVRCNSICPGTVDSPWVGRLLDAAADPVATRAALVARQPMGRLGTSEEVARAALYLASDDAAFITGTELVIDGGLMAG